MKHLKKFESFSEPINEGLFNWLFGKKEDKAPAPEKKKDDDNYISFGGRKFYAEDIIHDDYNSTGKIPRIEGNKLIYYPHPAWNENKKYKGLSELNEGFFSRLFRSKTSNAKKQGLSTKSDERSYIMFNGKKFYDENISYASYGDTGRIPRVEGGTLIIANPRWYD
jgi:hypothetical protein